MSFDQVPVSNNYNGFLSVVSYFGKRQDEQRRQERSYPAVVSQSALELLLCVHSLKFDARELLSITSKPEADRGKLEVFVTEPGAICSVVKSTIHLLEE